MKTHTQSLNPALLAAKFLRVHLEGGIEVFSCPMKIQSYTDAPAFEINPERWLVDTASMTDAEQVIYLRLLCHLWMMDGLPVDNKSLRILARSRSIPKAVLDRFPVSADGKRRDPSLEENRTRFRKSPPARFTVRMDLTAYQRRRRTANAYVRRRDVRAAVFAAHGSDCVQCLTSSDICLDHIQPVAAGGLDEVSNLQPLCRSCNSTKGGRV